MPDFDLYFAKLFDGIRHDSGCPLEWGVKAIVHFKKLNIDPHSKRLVFSDNLNLKLALELHDYFANKIQTGFGIGTNLSDDTGINPLNIMMKLAPLSLFLIVKIP